VKQWMVLVLKRRDLIDLSVSPAFLTLGGWFTARREIEGAP